MAIITLYIPTQNRDTAEPILVDSKNYTGYIKEATKFLYYGNGDEGLLIFGNFESHIFLVAAARECGMHVPSNPSGAGNIENGTIVTWNSVGFHVETPEELRPILTQALHIVK